MNQKNYGQLTNQQADYLLKLPKKVILDKDGVDTYSMDQVFPFNIRLELMSPDDQEFTFIWDIKQSQKNMIRISLHMQDNESTTGLLRVDFNGGHKNPETISNSLPERFHPYAGKEFTNKEHHIHYYVEGYKPLAWAIPLADDSFEIKELNHSDLNNSLISTVQQFAGTINLQTVININPLLI